MANYTQLGFIKQTDGENEGSWGDALNENLIDLLDDAIGGYVEVSVASGNVTLAFADGTADNNGRHAVIKFTGSPGTTRTVTFPDKQINYFIINGSDSSVICTSGTGAATVTIPTGMKDIIYIDGSDEVLSMFSTPRLSSSSDLTIDSGADIILDADGADVVIKDGGTAIGKFTNSSSDFVITTSVQDKDFIVKGDDGGSAITALTLDMSEAGAATFNNKVVATELDISGNMDIDGTSNLDAVDIDGAVQIDGTVTVGVDDTGKDVKFFGATSGSYILWDESADSLLLTDSTPIKIGDSQDLTLYHDGTNSYITNAVGALKIATETSGIAVTIGHTTSETTIADNATVTGNLSVGGNFDVTGSFDMSDADITNIGSIALDSITNDGTDITLDSSNDIVIDAAGGNVEFKDAGTLQFTIDMDGTAGAQVIKLDVDSDDLVFQQYDGNEVMRIADNRKVYFYDEGGEHISSDGTDFTFASGNDINLTATTDINVPADVGMTFGNDGEKIEGDGTDLPIASSGVLNLAAGGSTNKIKVTDGAILPITDDDVDLGSSSYQFKNAYIDGTLEADAITIGGTAVTAGGATAGFALAMAVAL